MPSFTNRFQVSELREAARLIAIVIVCLASLTAFPIQAQQNPNAAPGFRSDGVYDFSGIDDISIFNGALSLTIPLGTVYSGGGSFSYHLSLRYASSPWDSHSYSSPCTAGCPIEFQPKQNSGWDFNEAGEGDDLDSMHARHCDPRKGRFLSVDPVRGSPESPQSWNGYAYVQSNPLRYVDPDGRERAQILLDNDVRDLQSGKIDAEQYWERVRARGEGALLGVAVIETGIAVSGAIAGGVFRKAFNAVGKIPRGKSLKATNKQLGKKFGRHRNSDRPGYRTPAEYRARAQEILESPQASRRIVPSNAPRHAGETHIQLGDELLRLDPQGDVRSLYILKGG